MTSRIQRICSAGASRPPPPRSSSSRIKTINATTLDYLLFEPPFRRAGISSVFLVEKRLRRAAVLGALAAPRPRSRKAYFDGDAVALGEALAAPPPEAGEATVGLLVVVGATDPVPNQFH